MMKYLSLFSGVGGFELGIKQAYEIIRSCDVQEKRGGAEIKERVNEEGKGLHTISSERALFKNRWSNEYADRSFNKRQPHCIGFSEIDKFATKVYQHHFPTHKAYGDITKINEKELPDFELLVGGFPCQSFSIAGKRGGFNDTRGTMFFEIARIIKQKQPRLLLLENVKGLLSHDKGNTFTTIITTLDELGYDCQWQVLNSKDFGVPQNRERVFIIGHLRGTPRPQVFPITRSSSKNLKQLIGRGQGNRVYSTEGVSVTLASQAGGQGAKTGLYAVLSPDRGNKQNGRRMKHDGEPSFTLTAQDRHGVYITKEPDKKINRTIRSGGRASISDKHNWDTHLIDGVIRRLTPLECERLQGFPDLWTDVEGMSDTQRYKQMGNAVTVNVIQAIMQEVMD